VRVDGVTIALRRREAWAIIVTPAASGNDPVRIKHLAFALIGTPKAARLPVQCPDRQPQKVANYPGVTVERKAGHCRPPAGRSVN